MTGNLSGMASERVEVMGQRATGLWLPLVLLAVANALDVVTTGAAPGVELNPIAGWLLERGWLAEAKALAVTAVAGLALLAPPSRWIRAALWTAVVVYALAVASNTLLSAGVAWY